jgi:hypothetical protein
MPPHAAGRVDVVVTNPDGNSARLTGGYTYAALTVASIAPAVGYANNTATILGAGFASGPTVTIGGAPATVRSVTSGSILVTVPVHEAGVADVVVTNPSGQTATLAGAFTFEVVTLTAAPASVTVGEQLTVSWSNTSRGSLGTDTLTAPLLPGQYEFRYLPNDGFVDIARRNAVTVTSAPAYLSDQTASSFPFGSRK